MNELEKQRLRKNLSDEEISIRYGQAVKYFMDGAKTGIMDKTEYKVFVETLPKRDLNAAALAWFNLVINFEEYFNIVQAIVGFDLIIQGIMDGRVKAKSNGHDTENEIDVNGDMMRFEENTNEEDDDK